MSKYQAMKVLTLMICSGLTACNKDTGNNTESEKHQHQTITEKHAKNWIKDPASLVDPFIGTEGVYNHRQAANVVPGAVLPHGMFNFGPEHAYTQDLLDESKEISKKVLTEHKRIPVSPGGYNYAASRIKGFSFTRLSGTGCLGASGDIPVLPFTSDIKGSPETDMLDAYYSAGFSHDNETAIPGYYQVKMHNGVNVELSATTRTGIAKFAFDNKENAKLLFKTSHSQLGSGDAQTQVNLKTGEITGSVTSGNFCGYLGEYNRRDYYTLHFVAQLDVPLSGSGSWRNDKVTYNSQASFGGMGYGKNGVPKLGSGSGVWVNLDLSQQKVVTMKVGISYVSLANARENLAHEQSQNYSFVQVRKSAYEAWGQALNKVKVVSTNKSQLTTFYTALFHSQFHPNIFSDVNGEYLGFDQKLQKINAMQEAQYANFSGWDVYRSQLQLITLLNPKRGSDIAQSLLNQAIQYNGIWDRWTHNSGPTGVMSGDPSSIAIANFVAFGANEFDVKTAYNSLTNAATVPTKLDLSDEGCPVFCRGQHPSLDQWLDINYIADESNSWEGASETLEQASADFALSQLAKRLDKKQDALTLLARSGYWKNLFNPLATENQGYIQGRNKDGSWKSKFDANSEHLFVEGSPAQYLWMVPFDGKGLNALIGGDDVMTKRLDQHFHKPDGSWVLFRDEASYADVSNQPSIASPWMYLFTGNAYKTQDTIRETLNQLWNTSTKGIPGQDDLGQMSSWYVFSALGLYPLMPGRADLVLTSPIFPHAKIANLTINAPETSNINRYIKSLKINDELTERSWIDESYIKEPLTLDFELSNSPNTQWGKSLTNRPPSYATTKLATNNKAISGAKQ
ncbi:GH92 family glycosyl hydrolase [Pseudoalteromonas denitrificans]|uniref:Alpha-1,2-mannosidase, putative n=1 Tax=Pseudoalteromonas denitrificans DSM 6059 TaxID=1123010 RepID=A0A1I1RJ52_9GAMM|nr:GH92 family glycosyl hydrolase [Pseudoalteromonas denitrificans]SFD34172.1 alpha-1,2-mannosidase, putative [Pseudoalteromonas denitrificans DSM 6059]